MCDKIQSLSQAQQIINLTKCRESKSRDASYDNEQEEGQVILLFYSHQGYLSPSLSDFMVLSYKIYEFSGSFQLVFILLFSFLSLPAFLVHNPCVHLQNYFASCLLRFSWVRLWNMRVFFSTTLCWMLCLLGAMFLRQFYYLLDDLGGWMECRDIVAWKLLKTGSGCRWDFFFRGWCSNSY